MQLPAVLEKYRERMGLANVPAPQDPAPWTKELDLDAETLHFYKVTDWARLGDWDMIVPIKLKALVEEAEVDETIRELARKRLEERERDEFEALEAAVLDLIRLGRYERRAWSRQKRSIRDFMRIKASRVAQGSTRPEEHAV
jgi:predicted PhzF superfamily epimerase YddE/YHI9